MADLFAGFRYTERSKYYRWRLPHHNTPYVGNWVMRKLASFPPTQILLRCSERRWWLGKGMCHA